MGTWKNDDGLFLKFNATKAVPNTGGEYRNVTGDRGHVEFKLDLTTLTTANTTVSDVVFFPKTARIEAVVITGLTAAATATSALLNVGLMRMDRTTEVDFDGILAAATTAQMTAGIETRILKGGTSAGALLGSGAVATANPAYITAATTTGTYTAGLVNIRIEYMVP